MAPRPTEVQNPAPLAYVHWMAKNRKTLEGMRDRMEKYVDKHREKPPAYKVGDIVMLSSRTIKSKRPSGKLGHKFHGLFQAEKSSPRPQFASLSHPNGESTLPSTFRNWNHSRQVQDAHRIQLGFWGKRAGSGRRRI